MGTQAAQQQHPSWDGIVRRSCDLSVRGLDASTRSVDVLASTDSLDAHGDILEQDWDLARYKKNPVVLWHHNRFDSSPYSFGGAARPEDFLPIGKAKNVKVTKDGLEATLVFASAELNPLADRIFKMLQEGMLNAVSVGFRPGKVTEEFKEGRSIYRLADNELREISVVPIPSNPDAVAKSIAIERENLGRIAVKSQPQETPMTDEEKKALETAQAEAKAEREKSAALAADHKRQADEAAARVKQLEDELAAEKAKGAEQRDQLIEAEIEALVGMKLFPAEKDGQIALAKKIGLDEVKTLLAQRPDIQVTDSVKVGGKDLKKMNPAPAPADGGDPSAELAEQATKNIEGKAKA